MLQSSQCIVMHNRNVWIYSRRGGSRALHVTKHIDTSHTFENTKKRLFYFCSQKHLHGHRRGCKYRPSLDSSWLLWECCSVDSLAGMVLNRLDGFLQVQVEISRNVGVGCTCVQRLLPRCIRSGCSSDGPRGWVVWCHCCCCCGWVDFRAVIMPPIQFLNCLNTGLELVTT